MPEKSDKKDDELQKQKKRKRGEDDEQNEQDDDDFDFDGASYRGKYMRKEAGGGGNLPSLKQATEMVDQLAAQTAADQAKTLQNITSMLSKVPKSMVQAGVMQALGKFNKGSKEERTAFAEAISGLLETLKDATPGRAAAYDALHKLSQQLLNNLDGAAKTALLTAVCKTMCECTPAQAQNIGNFLVDARAKERDPTKGAELDAAFKAAFDKLSAEQQDKVVSGIKDSAAYQAHKDSPELAATKALVEAHVFTAAPTSTSAGPTPKPVSSDDAEEKKSEEAAARADGTVTGASGETSSAPSAFDAGPAAAPAPTPSPSKSD